LINKFDFNALEIKLDKAKQLFYLMCDRCDNVPDGYVTAEALSIELAAGGLSNENIQMCMKKFNRENKGYVDFLDFLTYVPLFVEIHESILSNPFSKTDKDPLEPLEWEKKKIQQFRNN
jgi:hypothetical protein